MLGVLAGFFVVWSIIGVGWFVGRRKILGENAGQTLSRLAFFVASPALLFETLSKARLEDVLGPQLAVAAISGTAVGVVYQLISRLVLKRETPESIIGAMSASQANSANLGIPIAVYVLGDASYVAPLLIFQLAFYNPLNFLLLDATLGGRSARQNVVVKFVLIILRNPMIVASGVALALSALRVSLPDLVLQPIHFIGGAAVPAMLMSFGMSLNGNRPLSAAGGRRPDILIASSFKLVLHPLLAFLTAHFLLGLDGHALFAATIAGALPTAQNVFVAANRYQQGVTVAKDTVLITTVIAVPAMIAIASLLH
ncbi:MULTISPECIES: AEC family transporter [Arthrobacter]|uniref:AEC family transporter n=2 Tax=Arthrobacter TaxID=1663 RepID=A0ABU9KKM2_9MICC|nr:AEC family transporter [Arthrobacter sp. YJM1]MDP5226282.1 AEC family transporter [Arthrobacter sp. YJM1]